jgi:hypothetical protein
MQVFSGVLSRDVPARWTAGSMSEGLSLNEWMADGINVSPVFTVRVITHERAFQAYRRKKYEQKKITSDLWTTCGGWVAIPRRTRRVARDEKGGVAHGSLV